MDIATVSVIATATIGLFTIGGTIWNSLQPGRVAREARVEERRADAYVEILRLAEHESLTYNSRLTNALIAATEGYPHIEDRLPVPEDPPVDTRASLAAQTAAFASKEVATAYRTWRTRMDEIRGEWESIAFYWSENLAPDEPVDVERLKPLRDELRPAERHARVAMADRIAAELRHRPAVASKAAPGPPRS